ncbi:hypothetical protein [Arthrobacter glacialis]|uniref:hypothetical protein n=1 Tax=Arthrobacter glacialis TaxID=1664 RepID=UPI000CD466E5|nr:hypothetical protein [Arthrobacter glacialis]POH58891.1 hypothetical protein CVS28_09285 [Arthrobacter glacialis]
MGLTVEQLLAEIIKFLQTGQPNMAVLYMHRALAMMHKEPVLSGWELFLAPFKKMAQAVGEFFDAIVEPVVQVFRSIGEAFQSDFALCGES